ncbi:DNA gyrase/topoisomerase IV [Yasminevirus sp. GU-2018]|uniref:DNA topoisomerase 2 n=1 Tax=Yasminevirus sp. GU-2018 TaxID=2420051 RepID=A0A5K0UA21_9VIRU|nr:DNA gyrase/topoisomerase IV [Yasminevirus sp. GU-2018]
MPEDSSSKSKKTVASVKTKAVASKTIKSAKADKIDDDVDENVSVKSTSKTEQKTKTKKAVKSDDGASKDGNLDVEDVYKGMTLHQHILSAPDTYIGTTLVDEVRMFIFDEDTNKINEDVINYVAGFFKTFDEILVNARDHTVRDKTCKNIRITIDRQSGRITVWNDGNGIPVAIHKKYNIYVPEMIFGNLLTSQNYGKKGKTVGGKNGYGAKLCLKKGTTVPLYNGNMKKIEDVNIKDQLIGDDGSVRNVTDITEGEGKLYEIRQQAYNSYIVNEEHILCLRMPDHKVIFWSETEKTWNMLWLDKQKKEIRKKSIRVYPKEKVTCEECGEELSSNLKRHYTRLHPGIEVPKIPRKSPTTTAPNAIKVKEAKKKMEKFAKTIPDDNTLDISVKEYMKLNATTQKRLTGYVGRCVQWEHGDVDIDPYVLGLWLGDGFQRGDRFAINARDDPEILEYLEKWGKNNDAKFTQGKNTPYTYGISSLSKCGVAPLKSQLVKYNLINNKHIPREYLVNSRDTRLKVLAGLIDSDGYVSRDGTRISITQGMNHEQLANDIILLARSLGFMCCTQIVKTSWKYEGELREGEGIRINISGPGAEDIPTRVARKKCNSPVKRDTTGTGCISISEVDGGEYVGVAVDGNQRFVLGDFTVTHNCNIYSSEFEIHTIGVDKIKEVDGKIVPDENAKKVEYKQTFRNNMYDVGKPEINTKISQASKMFTQISYLPDYERYGMNGLTNDMYALLIKRCYDIAACTPKTVNITVNGEDIKCRKFEDYIKLYYSDDPKDKPKITYEKVNDRWEIGIGFNKNVGDRYISFVNGISTFQGGTHVAHVVNNVVAKVTAFIKKKKEYKDLKIMPATIKQYLTFFINCVVEDPGFNSQTKEYMNSKVADWCTCGNNCKDVKCELSDEFIEKLCGNGLMTEVINMSKFKEMRDLDKTDGKKVGNLRDIPKLLDADWAGKRNSHKTSIFFTEGDSAKAFAVSGISVIGNDRYGVFPLRGKLLNVRNANAKQIKANAEFLFIKRILGLKQGMKYRDVSKLRYGSIIILTDQDPDGSHIKGLIINMLEYFWPELLQIKGFVKAYNTPIVKAWKRTDKKKANVKQFYSMSEFEKWRDEKMGGDLKANGWEHKYYKGLGTSTEKEAKESFNNFEDNLVTFLWEHEDDDSVADRMSEGKSEARTLAIAKLKSDLKKKGDKVKKTAKSKKSSEDEDENAENNTDDVADSLVDEDEQESDAKEEDEDDEKTFAYMKSKSHAAITKAFDESLVNLRKEWLQKFLRSNLLEYKPRMQVPFSDFIDRDLIFFSNTDNDRSIPSVVDGLKPSQRMILHCCFKRGRRSKEVKVAQLSGYVSENTDYHHGEASLQGAIIGMAQNYPGSNNINLLKPNGNFGYRRQGGKDHASARYIFTELDPITNFIFREEDDEILNYNYNDDMKVEPDVFAPIIPLGLINGSQGIGTGFSNTTPPHNPRDVVTNLKRLINDEEPIDMLPWYNGFKGTVEKNPKADNKYIIRGKYRVDGAKVHIEDIPIVNGWIEPYEAKMDAKVSVTKDDGLKIESIKKNPGNNNINMVITFKGQELQKMFKAGTLEKFLNMTQSLSVTNLNMFNAKGKMTKYDSIEDVLREFYEYRLGMYEKRKEFFLLKLQNDLDISTYKVKFIKEYLAGTIKIAKKKVTEVISQLEAKGYPKMAHDHRTPEAGRSYRYLTDMSILTLTDDKIKELEENMEHCQMLYDQYLNTPIKKIWLKELDEFLVAYEKWCTEWEEENEIADKADPKAKDGGRGKKGRSKKSTKADDADDVDADAVDEVDSDEDNPTIKISSTSSKTKSSSKSTSKSDKSDVKKVVKKVTKKTS